MHLRACSTCLSVVVIEVQAEGQEAQYVVGFATLDDTNRNQGV
jgi:hypothetical protein